MEVSKFLFIDLTLKYSKSWDCVEDISHSLSSHSGAKSRDFLLDGHNVELRNYCWSELLLVTDAAVAVACNVDRIGEWYDGTRTRSLLWTLHNYRQGRFTVIARSYQSKGIAAAVATASLKTIYKVLCCLWNSFRGHQIQSKK